MNALESYNRIFCEIFAVSIEELNDSFNSDTVENWDSVLQLSLVTAMEDAFDLMFEPEDIMDFKSYQKGRQILEKNGIILNG